MFDDESQMAKFMACGMVFYCSICLCCCGLFALQIFFWVALFQDNAGPNIKDESCTDCYTIMLTSLCLSMGPAVLVCCAEAGKGEDRSGQESNPGLNCLQCLAGLANLGIVIWGFVDFFGLTTECQHIIRNEGSLLLWDAYQIWTYLQLTLISLLGMVVCVLPCLYMCSTSALAGMMEAAEKENQIPQTEHPELRTEDGME